MINNPLMELDFSIDINQIESINDLEIKELDGNTLDKIQMDALRCFRQLRLSRLRKLENEDNLFHSQYEYFRRLSNFVDYKDFLNRYCFSNT